MKITNWKLITIIGIVVITFIFYSAIVALIMSFLYKILTVAFIIGITYLLWRIFGPQKENK